MEYGLIGKTLCHSFSAEIHPKLFDCEYALCELKPDELEAFFKARDFKGINVTIPYKRDVIKYLDDIDDKAKRTGAVNTVINRGGKLTGYNTDYSGLNMLISSTGVSVSGKDALVLGSGATSKTAAAVLEDLGARSVTVISRTPGPDCDTYGNIGKYYACAQIIVNTTPCGTYPNIYESALSLDGFKRLEAVFDVVYNPIRSKLVCDARKSGLTAEGGTVMLVFQAVAAARLFSSLDIPDEAGFEIIRGMLKEKENIVLIGMPASGKTTCGKILAELLGKEFIDTDAEIEKTFGRSPKEIINTFGEAVFREYETQVIRNVSAKQGMVVATGGGSVERETNIELLKENGRLIFIKRPFEFLSADPSRPLSKTKEKLAALYEKRTPLYKKYADLTVDGKDTARETADLIREMIN